MRSSTRRLGLFVVVSAAVIGCGNDSDRPPPLPAVVFTPPGPAEFAPPVGGGADTSDDVSGSAGAGNVPAPGLTDAGTLVGVGGTGGFGAVTGVGAFGATGVGAFGGTGAGAFGSSIGMLLGDAGL